MKMLSLTPFLPANHLSVCMTEIILVLSVSIKAAVIDKFYQTKQKHENATDPIIYVCPWFKPRV